MEITVGVEKVRFPPNFTSLRGHFSQTDNFSGSLFSFLIPYIEPQGIHLPVRISNLKMIASAKGVISLDPDSDLFKTTIGLCLVESCSPRMEV